MKINKLLIIALIIFALICLPISFASDLNIDQIGDSNSGFESINQGDISSDNNLKLYSDNSLSDSDSVSDDNSDDSLTNGLSDSNSNSDDSNLINQNIEDENNLKDYNQAQHSLGNADTKDYNSPNLDINFTKLNVTFTDGNTIFVNASYIGDLESGTRENPFKTINAAYNQFISSSNTKTNIFLANGLYTASRRMTLSKSVNIVGESTSNTIISGDNIYQIFYISPPMAYGAVSPFVNIFNLTFTKGTSYYGGALYVNESGSSIVNVNFINNTAVNTTYSYSKTYPGSGGAVYIDKGFVKFYNTSFIDNKALGKTDAYGGALLNDMGEITIISCNFENNSVIALNGAGGALYDYSCITVLFNSTVYNNIVNSTVSMGGGISNWQSHNIYVFNSTIDSNKLYGNYTFGSAIINKANYFIMANTTISNNLANGTSDINGTIFNLNGILNFSNLVFENNILKNPQSNLFMCLEDQLILERPFSDDLLLDLPSKYDFRDYGLVNPLVKDQAGAGACWAFSTLEALESYLLKYENASYDFSENNMKNLMGYYGLNGTDWSDGGNHYMSLAYLLRWSGPVNETQDPYNDSDHSSKSNLNLTKHVQDVLYIPVRLNYMDLNQVKYALMTYGALYTTMHADDSFRYTIDYYRDVISVSNHAVTLVGWDDNYSADNFAVRPPGDGAFIIKNSWGKDNGYEGYWYISYYDKAFVSYGLDVLAAMAFTNVENVTNYKTNYQYDILGNTFESIGFTCSTAWFANQFKAKNNNPLAAFGFYSYGDSSYFVNITVNDVEKYVQEGFVKGAGYHTVKLDELVELTKNDIFRVAVKLTTPITLFPVAIESQRADYSSGADAEEGQSFISPDGINWYDLAEYNQPIKFYQYAEEHTLEKANVCLKAYAVGSADMFMNLKSNSTVYYDGDIVEFTLTISNEGDAIENVNVSAILDRGTSIKSVTYYKGSFDYSSKVWHLDRLSQGETVTLKLKITVHHIKDIVTTSFDFNYPGYIPSNISSSVSLDIYYGGLTSFVQVENIITIAKSQDEVIIRLLDWNSSPLVNKNILISLLSGGDDFSPVSLVTDEEGNARFILDLVSGNYKFLASFEGMDYYDPSNMSFNVTVNQILSEIKVFGDIDLSNLTTYAKSNDEIIFYLIDDDSNIIKDKTISLAIMDLSQGSSQESSQEYELISDEDGYFKFNIDLIYGTYGFNLDFMGDDVYKQSDLSFNVNVIRREAPTISIEKKILDVYDNLKISLKDVNGDGLANKTLKLIITRSKDDPSSLLTETDENGIVELINLYAGSYSINASFENDDVYEDAALIDSFSVIRKDTQISFIDMVTTAVDAKSDGAKTGEYFIWQLLDGEGNPIANTPMQIGFNGVVYTYEKDGICTDENGFAKLQINLGYKGVYTFAVCYLGDDYYKASFVVAKITVNTQNGTLEVPNKSYAASAKTKTLTASFKSAKGNPVADKWVTFTVAGKTYKAKTNAKGLASVNVSLNKKGTYNFTAKYAGDSTYSAISKTAKLTIK